MNHPNTNRPTIAILNGPNLKQVGLREPNIYGMTHLDEYINNLGLLYQTEFQLDSFFSNHEGELIDHIYECVDHGVRAIIINAGGYTHTSVALADCIRAIETPVIEVHISNTASRETFRHTSLLSPHVQGTITGFGVDSYRLAIEAIKHIKKK